MGQLGNDEYGVSIHSVQVGFLPVLAPPKSGNQDGVNGSTVLEAIVERLNLMAKLFLWKRIFTAMASGWFHCLIRGGGGGKREPLWNLKQGCANCGQQRKGLMQSSKSRSQKKVLM